LSVKKRLTDSWKLKLDLLSLGIPFDYIQKDITIEEISEALEYKKKTVEDLNGRLLYSLDYLIMSKEQGKDENNTREMRNYAQNLKELLIGDKTRLTKLQEKKILDQELERMGIKPV